MTHWAQMMQPIVISQPAENPAEQDVWRTRVQPQIWVMATGSSNVDRFGYVPEERRLYVWFLNGSLYVYEGVDPSIYTGMITAPSRGSYVWKTLRSPWFDFPYQRLV